MLLFYATVVSALFGGSSSVRPEVKCNGGSLTFPIHLTPPLFNGQLYFTPSTGGRSRLLMDKGEAKHPRIKVQSGSLRLIQLTEMDEGIFSISRDNGERQHAVTLTIIACVDEVMRDYGGRYSTKVPREAEFLEFTPLHGVDQLKVLWNRSDPQAINGGRGQINRNFYEIGNLNQADMGYYIFRGKDNNLLIRIKLIVKELRRYYNTKVHDEVLIENPMAIRLWTVAFTPVGEKENQTLMSGGRLLREEELDSYSVGFAGRLRSVGGGVQIYPVQITDSGTFAFRDRRGHLFQTAELVVDPDSFPTLPLVGLIVGILFALIFCCCCVRKCCCKKRAEFAPQAAAPPAVCLHDTNQPGCPSYYAAPARDPSTPYSMSSLVPREHTTISLEPLVAPPGGEGVNATPSLATNFLSSDTEPTFQLKGPQYAPPLSSSSAFSDVYTSDKLNFL
ncbi:uncharacterized protein LOC120818287 isoform X2 [Gasterosteus aculeatus]